MTFSSKNLNRLLFQSLSIARPTPSLALYSTTSPINPSTPSPSARKSSVNPSEIAHFSKLSSQWWDESGELSLLHRMNPPRLEFLREKLQESMWREDVRAKELPKATWLEGKKVLDVGCGGGLLSESLARLGANTLGIDATPTNIPLAQSHAALDPMLDARLEYRHQTAEQLLEEQRGSFDVVCALEVLEHVDEPRAFLNDLAGLVKPGGHLVLSTISRTALAHLLTITLAETVLRLVSPGTHTSSKFVKPTELDEFFDSLGWTGPERESRGVIYNPLIGKWVLVAKNTGEFGKLANYLYFVRKPLDG
ncbi:hexaprenyldihydroxybenzoate methyltransferase [Phaffia rhodozyma]|uniref:Ubiquinone biosynthesis O-methyltransferase, mitochondrial n=1 Tax=Phaffia rhodozyma TaxID=264483 RepID=A0A0F7SQX3_PHARH|nr:hexaprenyldihydroxybenzoate methyltransferase [Phaffia rhodozyma]